MECLVNDNKKMGRELKVLGGRVVGFESSLVLILVKISIITLRQ
jgi:tetrahydromethanopterin S-methyltransferase subunit G